MIVLFDHNVPRQLRLKLGKHLVLTARSRDWNLLANGNLMRAAERETFDVLLTCDKDYLQYEHDVTRKIAIVFVNTNHWPSISAAHEKIRAAVEASRVGSFERVHVEMMRRKKKKKTE